MRAFSSLDFFLETLPNNMRWCRCFLISFILRLFDPETPLFSAILQLWSLESLWPLKPSSSPLRQYRHISSSEHICNILFWLEILNYCPDGGNWNFQCFRYFLTATFYFVKLNNLFLHIRTIFFGFTHCDGYLREFGLCFPSFLYSCETKNLHVHSHPGVRKIFYS